MQGSNYRTRVAFSVINCICFDQRVQKIAGTVSSLDCDITIIGRRLGECCEKDSVPFRTKRFRMLFKRGLFFYSSFNIRLFFYLLFHKFELLVANDLDTLLPNYLVSKLKHLPLVYDSHEYFTGVPELNNKPVRKWFWKTIERSVFPHLKYVMTVSNSVADQYEKEFRIKPSVIRNCSRISSGIAPYSRQELGLPANHLLLIFQGGGINIDKGGEELIEALIMTENVSLLIVGSGDVVQALKEKAEEPGLLERIKFIPKVPWEELMRYTRSADAGMSLEKDTNLNYKFSLPNKLFDYISAGIPVITGSLPEIRKVVEENDCGIIIPDIMPREISRAIIKLRDDPDLRNKLKMNSINASKSLNWENESKKIIDFYNKISIFG
ncbi:MAG: glycosyltransferase [Bacteroidia bacterium]|nr:glycosyltransferase [Bacteroidia bacterium]